MHKHALCVQKMVDFVENICTIHIFLVILHPNFEFRSLIINNLKEKNHVRN